MKISLIDYTGAGSHDPARHAANVLVFTKQTRLAMEPGLMEDIRDWPEEVILEELGYMSKTIPSSWEFVDYTFLVNDVTRACTHQLVRTRTNSFAQQTMRVLDVSGWTYETGPSIEGDEKREPIYRQSMADIAAVYDRLICAGAKIEDARGVLPTNIHTNIVIKTTLRGLAETARKRASSRTQGEYRSVMDGMLSEATRVHPWAELFLDRDFDKVASGLEGEILELGLPKEKEIALVKLVDELRASA